jgi:predicted  nucleic acid-binding Zn-ribbon protein
MTTTAIELAKRIRSNESTWEQTLFDCHEAAALIKHYIEQQAERIAALEAKCALLAASLDQAERERDDYRDLGQKTIGELSAQTFELESEISNLKADRESWRDQASQRVADWDEMRKERDELKRDKS